MKDRELPPFQTLHEDEESSARLRSENEATLSIDLRQILVKDVTLSGSFDVKGLKKTAFGQLMYALPLPAMLVDQSGKIGFLNEAWGRFTKTPDEMNGKPFSSIFASEAESEDAARLMAALFQERKPQVKEIRLLLDNNLVWARIYFRAIRFAGDRAMLVIAEDMTAERKQIELLETISRGKREWERTVDSVPDLIATIDGKYRVVRLNRALAERAEVDPSKAVGMPCFKLVHAKDSPPEFCPFGKLLEDGAMQAVEYEEPHLGGLLLEELSPLHDNHGRVIGCVCFLQDVTERRRAEQLVLKSERLRAVGELASGVAHNFSNLLQSIISGAELALNQFRAGATSDLDRRLQQILDGARLGAETVKRLKSFAGSTAEAFGHRDRVFDLANTVRQAIEMSRPWWESEPQSRGIHVSMGLDLKPGCLVKGSETELMEVIVNLVRNSVDALPEGGRIEVSLTSDENDIYLIVKDNGAGIAPEHLAKIFQPFWTTKGPAGMGMGLATCFGIVGRHKGEIRAHTEKNAGAAFTVRIPSSDQVVQEPSTDAADTLPKNLSILVIDDVDSILSLLSEGLTDLGHKVRTATSGEEGLRIYLEWPAQLIICDFAMPGMTGVDVAKEIERISIDRGSRRPRFILLTGWGVESEGGPIMSYDCIDQLVSKPVMLTELIDVIQNLFGNHLNGS